MKLNAANGKGVGKKGNSVFSINHGVQIEREYNSHVSNPNTPEQVSQRARFKLISQVSAAVEPVLVFRRKGLQSPRNIFTKVNMGFVYADVEGAQVTYENLQIAPGNNGLPAIYLERSSALGQDNIEYGLLGPVGADVKRVIFCFFIKGSENRLTYVFSRILETPLPADIYMAVEPASAFMQDQDIICLAYGMKDKNKAASAKYYSYQIMSGEDIARLVANRKLDENNYTFTQTRGTTLGRGQSASPSPSVGHTLLYITALDGGSVDVVVNSASPIRMGSGYLDVQYGDRLTLTPVSPSGVPEGFVQGVWQFKGWYNNGSQTPFSTENPLSLIVNGMLDIVADWYFLSGIVGLE